MPARLELLLLDVPSVPNTVDWGPNPNFTVCLIAALAVVIAAAVILAVVISRNRKRTRKAAESESSGKSGTPQA